MALSAKQSPDPYMIANNAVKSLSKFTLASDIETTELRF
jgi:hypothetical protein